jgi:hypothetical protein
MQGDRDASASLQAFRRYELFSKTLTTTFAEVTIA